MVKKEFWPFYYIKWGWSRERKNAMGYGLYLESLQMQNLDWENAYWQCRDDINYIDKHSAHFEERYKVTGICRFLAVAFMTILAVMLAVSLCSKELGSLQLIAIVLLSLTLVAAEFFLRTIYYRGVEFNLVHADNRLQTLAEIWSDIINLVVTDLESGSTDVPDAPEKLLDTERFKSAAKKAVEDEDLIEDDIAVVFGNNNNEVFEDTPEEPSIDWNDLRLADIAKQINVIAKRLQEGS